MAKVRRLVQVAWRVADGSLPQLWPAVYSRWVLVEFHPKATVGYGHLTRLRILLEKGSITLATPNFKEISVACLKLTITLCHLI